MTPIVGSLLHRLEKQRERQRVSRRDRYRKEQVDVPGLVNSERGAPHRKKGEDRPCRWTSYARMSPTSSLQPRRRPRRRRSLSSNTPTRRERNARSATSGLSVANCTDRRRTNCRHIVVRQHRPRCDNVGSNPRLESNARLERHEHRAVPLHGLDGFVGAVSEGDFRDVFRVDGCHHGLNRQIHGGHSGWANVLQYGRRAPALRLLDGQRLIDRRIRDATPVHPDISRRAPRHPRVDDVGPKFREDVESIDDGSFARGDLVGIDVVRAPLDVLLRRDLHCGKRARRCADHDANRDRVSRCGQKLLAALKADASRDDLILAAVARNVERPTAKESVGPPATAVFNPRSAATSAFAIGLPVVSTTRTRTTVSCAAATQGRASISASEYRSLAKASTKISERGRWQRSLYTNPSWTAQAFPAARFRDQASSLPSSRGAKRRGI